MRSGGRLMVIKTLDFLYKSDVADTHRVMYITALRASR